MAILTRVFPTKEPPAHKIFNLRRVPIVEVITIEIQARNSSIPSSAYAAYSKMIAKICRRRRKH
jgi:hypothetical protein